MRLLDRLFPARLQRCLCRSPREIGRRCQPAVERAIHEDLALMSFAEARGYLRARARPAVQMAVAACRGGGCDAFNSTLRRDADRKWPSSRVIVRMIAEQVKSIATAPAQIERRLAA